MLNLDARLKSFKNWPFDADCSCTPKRMAEAGLYFCGGDNEPDLVRCYFCRKELDGWEPEDDPWKEHESHARGSCAYINLGKKPHELTVTDVLGTLEPEKHKKIVRILSDTYEEEVRGNIKKFKQKLNILKSEATSRKSRRK